MIKFPIDFIRQGIKDYDNIYFLIPCKFLCLYKTSIRFINLEKCEVKEVWNKDYVFAKVYVNKYKGYPIEAFPINLHIIHNDNNLGTYHYVNIELFLIYSKKAIVWHSTPNYYVTYCFNWEILTVKREYLLDKSWLDLLLEDINIPTGSIRTTSKGVKLYTPNYIYGLYVIRCGYPSYILKCKEKVRHKKNPRAEREIHILTTKKGKLYQEDYSELSKKYSKYNRDKLFYTIKSKINTSITY